jgi:hypothetical protein
MLQGSPVKGNSFYLPARLKTLHGILKMLFIHRI